ncbi:hypothetical protein PUN28_001358 [Cardiocondyla obscurior]|uniref:Uncharacterized protein n=1 Tax=Cardiocondyla obscurior TaxID=286306 RepID=A0AAW2H4L5_9HYME
MMIKEITAFINKSMTKTIIKIIKKIIIQSPWKTRISRAREIFPHRSHNNTRRVTVPRERYYERRAGPTFSMPFADPRPPPAGEKPPSPGPPFLPAVVLARAFLSPPPPPPLHGAVLRGERDGPRVLRFVGCYAVR